MKKYLIIVLISGFSISVFSKSTQVIVLGAQVQNTNKQEYLLNSNNLIDAARSKGEHVFIGAPSEYEKEFNHHENVTFVTVETQKELSAMFKRVNFENAESINLYIHAHGLPTTSEKRPDEVKILLGRVRLGLDHLTKMLNYRINKGQKLKVIAPFCFSGAVHQISYSRPNTCSASASDFRTPSISEFDCFAGKCVIEDSWATRFTEAVKSNKNSTLAAGFQIAQGDGELNDKRGSLSSIDFLKRLYSKAPYNKTRNWFTRVFSSVPEITPKQDAMRKYCKSKESIFSVTTDDVESLLDELSDKVHNMSDNYGFESNIPKSIQIHYHDKLFEYSLTFEKRKELFLGFFELGRKAKKLMDMGHGDEYQGQLSMASLYSEKLRLSSNDLLEFLKINDEIELINKLYKSKNLKNIKKFEELFYCENSN
jgi:hypothetical protein